MRLIGMPNKFAVVGPTARVRARYHLSICDISQACLDFMD